MGERNRKSWHVLSNAFMVEDFLFCTSGCLRSGHYMDYHKGDDLRTVSTLLMDGVTPMGCLSYGVGSHGLVDRDLHKYEHEKHTATLCDYLWAKAISSAYRQFAAIRLSF